MDRDFALLGLREEATKEEVKAAYERRLAKYKAADYADDPDYVRRKITELKAAYESALEKAEAASGRDAPKLRRTLEDYETAEVLREAKETVSEGEAVSKAAKTSAETAKALNETAEVLYEAAKEKAERREEAVREREEEERIRRRSRKEYEREKAQGQGKTAQERETAFQKPNLVSLKEKALQLKQYTKERSDEIKEQLQEYREEEKEFYAEEAEPDTPAIVLNEAGEQKVIFSENSRDGENKKSGKNVGAAVQIIIAVVIAIAGIAITGGDDTTDDYLYDDYNDFVIYEDSDYTGKNNAVREMGGAFSDYFDSGGAEYDEAWEPASDDDEKLVKAADRFAKLYTGCDSMFALCAELYNEVAAFPASEYDYVQNQVREVFNYYGFPSVEEVEGTVNPYTGKAIQNTTQYLKYLNRFYEEEFSEGAI